MKKIKTLIKSAANVLSVAVPFYALRISAAAGNYDFLSDTSIRDSNIEKLGTALKKEGAGLYSSWQMFGVVGIMCALAMAGTAVAMSHDPKSRQENKKWLVHACAGGIGIFGIVAIVGGLAALGKNIGNGLGV